MTLAALAPLPGQFLWDVGAGSGSIGIEWLRAEPTARAIAVERRADRLERARQNAHTLGVPELDLCLGEAPAALEPLEDPDAVFIGGGLTTPGLLERCWEALHPRGRLVANAVTLESEHVLHSAQASYGGRLVRIAVSRAEPVGGFTGWRPQLPVVQWSATKHTR
jgi:precorrin-6Y C5,15-methyltransferase (decarboxylating)